MLRVVRTGATPGIEEFLPSLAQDVLIRVVLPEDQILDDAE
jgi:hypothetical protein